ncbi:sulfate adenylyltransferase, partial [Candidatus Aerophobetes bacterium]|nr:sulfate adenylyltransferase [Candidatus Aerophobetes bacterium]
MLPHGGKLVERIASPKERQEILENAHKFKTLTLNEEKIKDVKNIAKGVYSPLKGFLKKDDFEKVTDEMRLSDGTVWPIPIILDISEEEQKRIKNEKDILLTNSEGKPVALLEDIQIYSYNKDYLAQNVFGTKDKTHPGVEDVYRMGELLVGGDIKLLNDDRYPFPEYNFSPREVREIFRQKGWKKIVAFQTRNVPHRGHEFLQKTALEEADGLFIQPVIGEKKIGDFKDEYILISYEILINRYYPKDKVLLGILPLKMRYAGPREAVFHALIRKNFGCTHFIVGRDHAGVGNFYGPFDAQKIFDRFKKEEIGINILKYSEVVYNHKKKIYTFIEESPPEERISFSGSKLREYIKSKKTPPSYLIRPEV